MALPLLLLLENALYTSCFICGIVTAASVTIVQVGEKMPVCCTFVRPTSSSVVGDFSSESWSALHGSLLTYLDDDCFQLLHMIMSVQSEI